ncbi:hypothetical protein F5Y19DRAFT_480564 [Xylariaceae sp. FL1651]|nr:hypothetical protein F5Y19DRAFT_480564 [Xylariaceae sp. FL1651]
MSVASITNPDASMSLAYPPRQSIKGVLPGMTASSVTIIDPPRPAKEGHEWVWFPAGYWAEREIAESPGKDLGRVFRWQRRSNKSISRSPKRSPKSPLIRPRSTEKVHDQWGKASSVGRHTTSSESSSFFPLNRTPDAPLPSPYLTEESHVQSLQSPSIDGRRGSISLKSRVALTPSPLHFSNEDEKAETDSATPTLAHQTSTDTSPGPSHTTSLTTPPTSRLPTDQDLKPKRSFMNWLLLSEHRQKPKRSHVASDEDTGATAAGTQSPLSRKQAASPLRTTLLMREESQKAYKSRPARLFGRNPWRRKTSASASSGASASSSIHGSIRDQSRIPSPVSDIGVLPATANAWCSEFPGGEATRVQTPHIFEGSSDRPPRSFFFDISTPMENNHPHSLPHPRQGIHGNHKKRTPLSTSFTATYLSPPSIPPSGRQRHCSGDIGQASSSGDHQDVGKDRKTGGEQPAGSRSRRRRNVYKEWWEVEVPVPSSYETAENRHQMLKTMAANTQRTFEFNIPEHLPTSPMCPANKRHKSGGTGVCVYHGRAKRSCTTSPRSGGDMTAVKSRTSEENADGNVNKEEDNDEDDEGDSDVWK